MKRLLRVVLALVLGLLLLGPVSAAQAAAPYCGIRWGSLPRNVPAMSMDASLTNVRTGRHACFDRMVLDVRGDIRGYDVRYTTQVHQEGSGFVVPLRGGAKLAVVARVPAYDENGRATYRPANPRELRNVTGYRTFRQLAWAGTFEGQSTVGLGVRARLPFRAFIVDGPGSGSRLVVDVAHRW
ncbi:AMIN-like domain-containing (lipo)protein [Georgenia sp. SUBG003]|uniref:AMIN-like domain-containing (lipo)protein n=1 Tax=Georgenia sp. SUBG003 TaxID=1497974 RepID=UPI0004D94C0F|nr:hypothetical protein DA06_23065 [Georgenia sp. SUBG003]